MTKIAIVVLTSLVGYLCFGIERASAVDPVGIEIELNKLEQTDAGCRLTFKSSNRLASGVDNMSIEVYLLDEKGVALQSLQLTFSAIAASKARFAKFDLKGQKCDGIGSIFVNEIKGCKLAGDATQACPSTIQLRNLTSIKFTDGVQ